MAEVLFTASVGPQNRVVIEREGLVGRPSFRLEMTPSEADKATSLIAFALGMSELPALPDHIADTPFVIRFFPKNGGLALERQDVSGSMPFRFRDGDDLIKIIQQGVAMAINAQQLQGPARPVGLRGGVTYDEVVG